MNTLGSRLTALRKEKGLTQEQLAEKLGVTNQSVSKWENDINAPDISILIMLADLYDTTVDSLLGREKQPIVSTTTKNIDNLILKIKILSNDNDKVNINLPFSLVKVFVKEDGNLSVLKDKNIDIDFNQLIKLVEEGVVGELVDIQSGDGDTVKIFIE